ncbi:hypothetical protein [Sinimarinibacterium thermocellulolyticum]|uniref:Uncharacterized protein n=1 Tax=Sinimarinibacterium thermocellulolyticum TaxID=3170016 RepID=A0ABV2A827_9GAMM
MMPLPARGTALSVTAMSAPIAYLCRALLIALGCVAFARLATAQTVTEPEHELDPIIVEGQRDPLDAIGAHRERLPCIGDCEAADARSGFGRLLRDLVELSIYGPPERKPEPVHSLEVLNPIKARLHDKQP